MSGNSHSFLLSRTPTWAVGQPCGPSGPPSDVRKEREFPLFSCLIGLRAARAVPEPPQTQKEREFPLY